MINVRQQGAQQGSRNGMPPIEVHQFGGDPSFFGQNDTSNRKQQMPLSRHDDNNSMQENDWIYYQWFCRCIGAGCAMGEKYVRQLKK